MELEFGNGIFEQRGVNRKVEGRVRGTLTVPPLPLGDGQVYRYKVENVSVKKTFAGTDQTTWNRVMLRHFDWPIPVFIRYKVFSESYEFLVSYSVNSRSEPKPTSKEAIITLFEVQEFFCFPTKSSLFLVTLFLSWHFFAPCLAKGYWRECACV